MRQAVCPLCATPFEARVWRIIDIDARPDLLPWLADGSYQRTYCPKCVGPGVAHTSSLLLIKTCEGSRRIAWFAPYAADRTNPTKVSQAVKTDQARLNRHAARRGAVPPEAEVLSTRLVDDMTDLAGPIEEAFDWELPWRLTDDTRTQIATFAATSTQAERRAIILAHPDLMRPRSVETLANMQDRDEPRLTAHIRDLLMLLAQVSRFGLSKALSNMQAEAAFWNHLQSLSRDDLQRLSALSVDDPDIETLHAIEARLATLIGHLSGPEHVLTRAFARIQVGEYWQSFLDTAPDLAYRHTARAFEAALGEDGVRIPHRKHYEMLMALSALSDKRRAGAATQQIETSLGYTERAEALLPYLSDEDAANLWMEICILYTRRLSGDIAENKRRAREAIAKARRGAISTRMSVMLSFNEALTFVEETTGNTLQSLRIGLLKLDGIAPSIDALMAAPQRVNFKRSLAVSILKLADHDADYSDRLVDAEAALAEGSRLAGELGNADEVARQSLLYVQCSFLRAKLKQIPFDPRRLLLILQNIQGAFTPDKNPLVFLQSMHLVAKINVAASYSDHAQAVRMMAIKAISENTFPRIQRRLLSEAAEHLLVKNDLWGALPLIERAAECCEAIFVTFNSAEQRAEEIEKASQIYETLIDLLTVTAKNSKDSEKLLLWMERARARQFLLVLGAATPAPPVGLPDDLLQREAMLREALASGLDDTDIFTALSPDADTAPADTRARLRAALDDVFDEISAHSDAGAAYVALRRPKPLTHGTLAAFAKTLQPGTTVFSLFATDTAVNGVWLDGGGRYEAVRCPIGVTERAPFFESFETDVLARDMADGQPPLNQHGWQFLGKVLFDEHHQLLAKTDHLILVPHGDLHHLPLHALMVNETPLIAQTAVQIVPSLSVLAHLRGRQRASGGASMAFSAPLEEVDRATFEGEAVRVADVLGGTLIRDATRADVLTSIPSASNIHICCHAAADDESPLNAALYLADGPLRAADLLHSTLQARLTTLSACETGRMTIGAGDQMDGFASVLLQAGSQSVLLTLWRVYSAATMEWMTAFYQALDAAQSLPSAHQTATLALMQRYPDPVYWAPFVMQGAVQDM